MKTLTFTRGAAILVAIACGSFATAGQVQAIPGSQPGFTATLKPTGVPAPSMKLNLAIGLQPRFPAEFKAFCDSVSNPVSPNYLSFLTPQQVGEAFGASATDVSNVVTYLKSQGITVSLVAQNRMAILAQATVAQANAAFGTQIKTYQISQGRSVFANSTALTVPSQIAGVIVNVGGVDNLMRPNPRTALTPSLARTLYNAQPAYGNGFTGSGRKIGVSNFDNFSLADARGFVGGYGLAVPAGGLGSNLHVVVVDAGFSHDTGTPGVEGNLDIQMELAAAPTADIYIYDYNDPSGTHGIDYLGMLTRETNDNLCDVLSESYGWPGMTTPYAVSCHNQHLSMTAQGMTYLAASGDAGTHDYWMATEDYNNGYPDPYPGIDPDVTNVGGTTAIFNVSGVRTVEMGWNGSGGGWATGTSGTGGHPALDQAALAGFNVLPSWQVGSGVPVSTNFRLIPDLSLQASGGASGAFFFIFNSSPNSAYDGTSFSSPFCAGCLGALEQRLAAINFGVFSGHLGRLGRINDMIYAENGRPDVWYDITTGPATGALPNATSAAPGSHWDFATGWGAPNFDAWYTAISTRTISGTITLGNFVGNVGGQPLTVQLYQAGTNTLVDTQVAMPPASGNFVVSSQAPPGMYDVYFKASHWLRRMVANQNFGVNGLAGLTPSLINGDVNGDNHITLSDFSALRSAFGSNSGSSTWNPNADLNGDGSVTLSDFVILRTNFGMIGD